MKKMLILLALGGAGGAAIGAAVSGDAAGTLIGGFAGAAAGALIGRATEPGYCVYRERRYPYRRYKAPC